MERSPQALRRSPVREPAGGADLPCYEMDELTEWQVSAPMPGRAREGLVDRDVTESLEEVATASPAACAAPAPRPAEPTQPIAQPIAPVANDAAVDPRPPAGPVRLPAAATPRALPTPVPLRRTRVAPGDVLCDRYLVEAQVARSGMGHVFRALDRQREQAGVPDARVALKLARHSVGASGETSALLRQEFAKLSQLRHPNIVDVFDIARDGELEFLVMEWLEGETLADLLERITTRRIALDRAVEIIEGTARALAYAHDRGIVHGDVKPSNIFLAGRGVKLLDFGSAGASTTPAERPWATRAYASPAVIAGRPPQPHDDVFALGVTAYCLLSGERPFGEHDALAARERHLEPPPLPEDALDRWPAIRHALALDAVERTANAGLFLEEFAEQANEHAPPGGDARSVSYGVVAAIVLACIVLVSVGNVGTVESLPRPSQAALAAAERALAEGRLAEPGEGGEGGALALFNRVLESEPGNRRALAGLDAVADRFIVRAHEAVAAGAVGDARASLALARRARPDHPGVALVEDLLAEHGRAALLEATQAAQTDPDRAASVLARAAAILPADDPGLARAHALLEAQRIERRVSELLQQIDARVLSERLTVPTGDSALDLLARARELAPDDPRLPLAADRIMTALLFQAMFAISSGDLQEAESFLAMARNMNIRHLALARAEYELAKARRIALTRRGQ